MSVILGAFRVLCPNAYSNPAYVLPSYKYGNLGLKVKWLMRGPQAGKSQETKSKSGLSVSLTSQSLQYASPSKHQDVKTGHFLWAPPLGIICPLTHVE